MPTTENVQAATDEQVTKLRDEFPLLVQPEPLLVRLVARIDADARLIEELRAANARLTEQLKKVGGYKWN